MTPKSKEKFNRKEKQRKEQFSRWMRQREIITKYTGIESTDILFMSLDGHKKLYGYVVVKEGLI